MAENINELGRKAEGATDAISGGLAAMGKYAFGSGKDGVDGIVNGGLGIVKGVFNGTKHIAGGGVNMALDVAEKTGNFAQKRPGVALLALFVLLADPVANATKKVFSAIFGDKKSATMEKELIVLEQDNARRIRNLEALGASNPDKPEGFYVEKYATPTPDAELMRAGVQGRK